MTYECLVVKIANVIVSYYGTTNVRIKISSSLRITLVICADVLLNTVDRNNIL